jgi:disulfide bond formation protein DsbB
MNAMMIPRLRWALLFCATASAAAVLFALSTERYGGLVPCPLCLVERWPYRVAAAVSLLGLLAPRRLGWVLLAMCVPVLLAAAAAGFVHMGVEFLWWASPMPECLPVRMPAGVSIAERLARMPATVSKSCEDPTFLIPFLPLSMAALNMLYALALATIIAIFLGRTRRNAT